MNDLPDDAETGAAIKQYADYHAAPADLRRDILRRIDLLAASPSMPLTTTARGAWRARLGMLFGGAAVRLGAAFVGGAVLSAVVCIVVSVVVISTMATARDETETLVALVSDHARAVVTGSATEVQSSSMHTVKPWLSQRLGYSPGVVDLADAGFPLAGGRRGFLGGQPVAVMTYTYKLHELDVYALPLAQARSVPRAAHLVDGYHTLGWVEGGFQYLAVSDTEAEAFARFVALLQQRQRIGR